MTLDDARFAGRQRGRLDMHIIMTSRLQATVDANSTEVSSRALWCRLRPAPRHPHCTARERRGRPQWCAGRRMSLGGGACPTNLCRVDGEGEVEFGANLCPATVTSNHRRAIRIAFGITLVDRRARGWMIAA
jgi:hypothetical protein